MSFQLQERIHAPRVPRRSNAQEPKLKSLVQSLNRSRFLYSCGLFHLPGGFTGFSGFVLAPPCSLYGPTCGSYVCIHVCTTYIVVLLRWSHCFRNEEELPSLYQPPKQLPLLHVKPLPRNLTLYRSFLQPPSPSRDNRTITCFNRF